MKEHCPICPNHCPVDALSCGRGRSYFSESSKQPATIEEKILLDLRKCGHFLHHQKGMDFDLLFSELSLDERNHLHELLSKITNKITE